MIRKSLPSVIALILSTTAAFASERDGFYNVSYNNISISLTQIGGFGELKVEPMGYGSMQYGGCVVNFTRDAAGAVQDMSPVATINAASCPDAMKFTLSSGKDGMDQITFSEGGDLAGQSFDLYPVLVPMSDKLKVAAPSGFDVLGMTPGQSRAEVEAILQERGFAKDEEWTQVLNYQDGTSRALDVWKKGTSSFSDSTPEDAINISYNVIAEGESDHALVIGRRWYIPETANLSITNLKKSLDEKHGATTSGFEERFYDRAGQLAPKSFKPVCDSTIHVQSVSVPTRSIGSVADVSASPACGASVKLMTLSESNGAASQLLVTLSKGDLIYEDFWKSWSAGELQELEARYQLQANMTASTPDL